MKNVLGSYDSSKYKVILSQLKEGQRILQLEELIDTEKFKISSLEQEARLLVKQIQLVKNKPKLIDKYRGSSLPKYYPEKSPYKEKAVIRNTLLSTSYKEY